MKNKVLWITRTAVMMALLVTLQWATSGLGQFVTGSCVNAVLAITVLLVRQCCAGGGDTGSGRLQWCGSCSAFTLLRILVGRWAESDPDRACHRSGKCGTCTVGSLAAWRQGPVLVGKGFWYRSFCCGQISGAVPCGGSSVYPSYGRSIEAQAGGDLYGNVLLAPAGNSAHWHDHRCVDRSCDPQSNKIIQKGIRWMPFCTNSIIRTGEEK